MADAQNIPALTAGGKRDADMATPTIDATLFPKTEQRTGFYFILYTNELSLSLKMFI